MKLLKNNTFYEIKLSTLNAEKSECLEAAENFDKKNKTLKKKRTLCHYLDRQEEPHRNNNIKSLIDFDEEYVTSVYLTTRFLNGKMFMFSKTFIQSFVYDLIDVFMFPSDDVKQI